MIKAFFAVAVASSAFALATPALAQDTTMAAAPDLPMCSASVKDSCMQTPAQQKRAMSGEQADARDARHGGMWTPDATAAAMPAMSHKRMMKKHMMKRPMMKKPMMEDSMKMKMDETKPM